MFTGTYQQTRPEAALKYGTDFEENSARVLNFNRTTNVNIAVIFWNWNCMRRAKVSFRLNVDISIHREKAEIPPDLLDLTATRLFLSQTGLVSIENFENLYAVQVPAF